MELMMITDKMILMLNRTISTPYAVFTISLGGTIVGYITNFIALKYVFEPLNPVKIGPFVFHGLFLARQKEVTNDFSSYISSNILSSQRVWQSILGLIPGSSVSDCTEILLGSF
jgi:uncharacterized membrane protein YheB (UPF0754 family)